MIKHSKHLKQLGANETIMYIVLSTLILSSTGVVINSFSNEIEVKFNAILKEFSDLELSVDPSKTHDEIVVPNKGNNAADVNIDLDKGDSGTDVDIEVKNKSKTVGIDTK